MRRLVGSLAIAVAAASCADARDLFRPYVPRADEMRATAGKPWPVPVLDVGLVLGCPADPGGVASPCERCRVDSAVRAYQAGQVRTLLFSGGAAHSPDVEADVMGDLAVARGVPKERVLREGRALTTWQNLRFSKRIADAHGLHTILFISTADHLPRVRRLAAFYGIGDERTAYLACDAPAAPAGEPRDEADGAR